MESEEISRYEGMLQGTINRLCVCSDYEEFVHRVIWLHRYCGKIAETAANRFKEDYKYD